MKKNGAPQFSSTTSKNTYSYLGKEYEREDCLIDLLNFRNGFTPDVPDAAYHYFKIKIPSSI